MRWESYAQLLGFAYTDNARYSKCINIILNELDSYFDFLNYETYPNPEIIGNKDYKYFCNTLGIRKRECDYNEQYQLIKDELVARNNNFNSFILCCVALINSMSKDSDVKKSTLIKILEESFVNSGIQFKILSDQSSYFILPNGAKELDDALVLETFRWLNDYPLTRKAWIDALKKYDNSTELTASETADTFRKALERFFQEFFNSSKSLENLKSEYGLFLSEKGVPSELKNNFEKLLDSYTNYINNYAKHHDKTSRNVLEYIMYQTGNLIRFLIKLKSE